MAGAEDGCWILPSGKLEDGGHAIEALMREAREEMGINLIASDLQPVGTAHYRNPEGRSRLGLFFATQSRRSRQGEPVNAEPHKCAGIA